MRTRSLLIGALVVLLTGCESASEPVAVDPMANAAAPAANGADKAPPTAHRFTQTSRGTTQPIGWCDEAAGVASIEAPGSGTGSLDGRFETYQTMCVDMVTGAVTDGASTVITANGDEISFTFAGEAVPGTTLPTWDLAYRVVGGTGRFANAEGEGDMRVVNPSPSTWVSTGTGWLRYSASDRSHR